MSQGLFREARLSLTRRMRESRFAHDKFGLKPRTRNKLCAWTRSDHIYNFQRMVIDTYLWSRFGNSNGSTLNECDKANERDEESRGFKLHREK